MPFPHRLRAVRARRGRSASIPDEVRSAVGEGSTGDRKKIEKSPSSDEDGSVGAEVLEGEPAVEGIPLRGERAVFALDEIAFGQCEMFPGGLVSKTFIESIEVLP